MSENKTQPNDGSVAAFLQAIPDEGKRQDALALVELMGRVTGEEPRMWGSSIVGFGQYHYRGRSREGEWFRTGFAPRKQALTLYIMSGFGEYAAGKGMDALLARLGKHTTGKGCLYIKRLADVDLGVL